jgi:hypothetical protein
MNNNSYPSFAPVLLTAAAIYSGIGLAFIVYCCI